ncbi:sensor histidine kinase [Leuconostoc mesenteroides]|uniref:sensor histidine kinase n=1 Tax=Leuconostoc mesenteroides TaxID=1245 RepID=UPI0013647851|nr:ATP-binding protein [Leuconostoc mesenteroides]
MTIFSLAIMSLMTMYALITIYSIVNILVIFDAIILLTGLLYYYTKVTRKIMESEQRNAYLVKQMDKLYVEMESMVSMREKERYAQDLHDSVTQDLIAIKLQLELVYNQLNTSIKTKCALKSLIDFTQRSVENARVQIANMKKDVKTVTNLSSDLLSNIIDKFEFEYQLSINSSIDDISLSNHIGVNLSSILNELLTNVVRHSRSSSVVVLFKKSDYGYDLSVIDFGIGMSTVRPRSEQHYGLQGITERVKNLNGHLTIESDMEEGTSVTASLPKGLFE